MKNLKLLILSCTLLPFSSFAGEFSGGGGRSVQDLFDSMSLEEAWSNKVFKKKIPSIQMPGTNSYFKATSLCLQGSKIRTKRVVEEACVKWSYEFNSISFETEDRALATRNNGRCISYNSSVLEHPINYSVEREVTGVPDFENNLRGLSRDMIQAESAVMDLVTEKRVLYKAMPSYVEIEFFDATQDEEGVKQEEGYFLGRRKYRLRKCDERTSF